VICIASELFVLVTQFVSVVIS